MPPSTRLQSLKSTNAENDPPSNSDSYKVSMSANIPSSMNPTTYSVEKSVSGSGRFVLGDLSNNQLKSSKLVSCTLFLLFTTHYYGYSLTSLEF